MNEYIEHEQKTSLSILSLKIIGKILQENPTIKRIFKSTKTAQLALEQLEEWLSTYLDLHPQLKEYTDRNPEDETMFRSISWYDYAVIRLMDYIKHEGETLIDYKLGKIKITNTPIKNLWLAVHEGKGTSNEDFFMDLLYLFRQINGTLSEPLLSKKKNHAWMQKHPSGLDQKYVQIRRSNKKRIILYIINKIDKGEFSSNRYSFKPELTLKEKYLIALDWWKDHHFHLKFAARDPDTVNEYLDESLRPETMKVLYEARDAAIPFFINPYYLSLLSVKTKPNRIGADRTLRDYVFHSKELIQEFGKIEAWEKEDIVKPGEPNSAGWFLPPYRNIHRRYPEVAIFIPDTAGRACGGLCVSCQRMYDFQSGHLNFDLDKLKPKLSWDDKIKELLKYYEEDSHLRDILITGGDAFMSSDASLKKILDAILKMAARKKQANEKRSEGEKYAEIVRIRLGTRLPAFLPQRITRNLVDILSAFKQEASKIGIKQFVIQTHIQSAMEVTPMMQKKIKMLLSSGWVITNQMVLTAAASRRGHSTKLRVVLNNLGVLPYYTFTVKGFNENYHNFTPNARSVQEKSEEKYLGFVKPGSIRKIANLISNPEKMQKGLNKIRINKDIPFLATDRSVMNMPAVGKSLTFRTIGITNDGRRILEFEHDHSRVHSPKVDDTEKVVITESKSIYAYLKQMEEMGEDMEDYEGLWGYSLSKTEARIPFYLYPEYDFETTKTLTNI